jgi:excisionase family DNA binding protein
MDKSAPARIVDAMRRVNNRQPETTTAGTPAQPVSLVRTPTEIFIDKSEVAQRLQKTQRSIDNWMKLGILPYYKIGRSVLFKWSEVEAHLAATCRVSRPN